MRDSCLELTINMVKIHGCIYALYICMKMSKYCLKMIMKLAISTDFSYHERFFCSVPHTNLLTEFLSELGPILSDPDSAFPSKYVIF